MPITLKPLAPNLQHHRCTVWQQEASGVPIPRERSQRHGESDLGSILGVIGRYRNNTVRGLHHLPKTLMAMSGLRVMSFGRSAATAGNAMWHALQRSTLEKRGQQVDLQACLLTFDGVLDVLNTWLAEAQGLVPGSPGESGPEARLWAALEFFRRSQPHPDINA